MSDDDKPDFLKEEEENDPAKIQKEYLEFAKEMLANMKKEKQDRKQREPVPETGLVGAYPADLRYYAPRPTFEISVQQIENGFVVHHGAAHCPTTEYAQYPEVVVEVVSRLLGGFLQRILPGQPVGKGVPPCSTPGPEAGKGLPGGSMGLERHAGPPPVHREPDGPLEP